MGDKDLGKRYFLFISRHKVRLFRGYWVGSSTSSCVCSQLYLEQCVHQGCETGHELLMLSWTYSLA